MFWTRYKYDAFVVHHRWKMIVEKLLRVSLLQWITSEGNLTPHRIRKWICYIQFVRQWNFPYFFLPVEEKNRSRFNYLIIFCSKQRPTACVNSVWSQSLRNTGIRLKALYRISLDTKGSQSNTLEFNTSKKNTAYDSKL